MEKNGKLNLWVLENQIGELATHLNYTIIPSKDTMGAWHRKLHSFTDKQLTLAVDKMKDDLEQMPRNFPKIAKDYIYRLFSFRDERRKWINYGDCQGCDGAGGFCLLEKHPLMGNRSPQQQWTEVITFCSECKNWQNLTGKNGFESCHATKKELENSGVVHVKMNEPISSWRRLSGKNGRVYDKTESEAQAISLNLVKSIG